MFQGALSGHLLTAFTITVWGATFISSKLLLQSFQPIEILFDRFLMGFIAMWLIMPRFLKVRERRHELTMALAGLFGTTLYFLCENIALVYSKASNVGVILATVPFFTGIVDRFLGSRKPLSAGFFIGFIVAMSGIALLTFSSLKEVSFNPLGDGLAVLAALTWAFYCLFLNRALSYGYKPLLVTRHVFGYGLIFMLLPMYLMGYEVRLPSLMEPLNAFNLIFLGIIASAMCYVTWSLSVRLIGTVKASAWLYVSPVITVVMAMLILDEKITALGFLGMFLALTGLILSQGGIRSLIRALRHNA